MKKRLDVLLTEQGLAPSREKAKALIMAGIVYVNNQKEDKAGTSFPEDAVVEVRGQGLRYVSRGGLKLEKAMQAFPIDLTGRYCMDIGASTGGFTDCMLQNGAAGVYAIDVGYGQLDWKLREDPRVICMEKTNFRYVKPEDLDPARMPDFASVDVSFISLSKILPVGKKGVVRDPRVHIEVIENVLQIAQGAGFAVLGLSWSPIRGPEGNIEYLMHLRRLADDTTTLPSAAPADPEGTLHQPAAESSAAPADPEGTLPQPAAESSAAPADAEGNVTDPAAAAPAPLSANSPADPGRLPTHEEICELVRKSHETL